METLIRVNVARDVNEYGGRVFTVTPFYRLRCGRVVSVPDARGWRTLAEAVAEAERLTGGECEFVRGE